MIGFNLPSSSKREGNSSFSNQSSSDDQSYKNEEEEEENEKKQDEFPYKHLLNDSVSSYWMKKYWLIYIPYLSFLCLVVCENVEEEIESKIR